MVRPRSPALNLTHQFRQAEVAIEEARNHRRAKWWASSVVHSFQVAHRAAAGLLLGAGHKVFTDRDVRFGFSGAFVLTRKAEATMLADYDFLAALARKAEQEYEYEATEADANAALAAAERFWERAQALRAHIQPPTKG